MAINMKESDFFKSKESDYKQYISDEAEYVILRLDGRSFSRFTKNFNRPFDDLISDAFKHATKEVLNLMQNVIMAYGQSDEVSILLSKYSSKNLPIDNTLEVNENSQWYFGGNINKILTITACQLATHFNHYLLLKGVDMPNKVKFAEFDNRLVTVTRDEINRYFKWRERDAIRNSITMYAMKYFSHKELVNKKSLAKLAMLADIGKDWNKLPMTYRSGWIIQKETRQVTDGDNNYHRTHWELNENFNGFKNKDYFDFILCEK